MGIYRREAPNPPFIGSTEWEEGEGGYIEQKRSGASLNGGARRKEIHFSNATVF
jgi:hypothetical protein